ncbi:MAG TPA: carbohydrate kinase family protein [Steroidobacteraceae bacterium]|nr:carbohydrate kinase family protein [Steroidobacteraceae bacterium]HNS28313.1 carbohydrate kinase family protein [Steroidobacteraceae bacterium]
MSALICGSVAFDTVMVFDGRFKDHILAERIHLLNVAFLVPALRRNFGGCAGNIAFNLKLLGGEGHAMATVGSDFGPYEAWMRANGLPLTYIDKLDTEYTAQAYITTDLDSNQITAFHPGAMMFAHRNRVPTDAGVSIGVVAPENRDGMIQHSAQFAAAGIPVLFDPGQGLPMFNGEDLRRFISEATWIAVNDYEGSLLAERAGQSLEEIASQVKALIVTRGGEGSLIHADGKVHEIPAARVGALADPTGCGDAYRAGLLYGLQNGLDWPTTGRIASLMGAIKIEHHGTQNHRFTRADFAARFRESFGREL